MRLFSLLIFLLAAPRVFAQVEIAGRVADSLGRGIAGVNILMLPDSTGTTTTADGRFIFAFPQPGRFHLQVSHVQYETQLISVHVKVHDNDQLAITLTEKQDVLEELQIVAGQPEMISVTKVRLNAGKLALSPVPFQDISNIMATLPSVTSNNELSTAYSVRGGSYDENLVLVNTIPVFRPFLVRSGQQEGLSFINTDLVSAVDFSAGGWPVQYDDKMSSVLAATYKQPQAFAGSAMISLLGGKAHVEGTLGKKVTYLAGVRHRRSAYLLSTLEVEGEYQPRFTDAQTYWQYNLSENTSLAALFAYANNNYQVTPESAITSFGTFNQELRLEVAFDGRQQFRYHTYQGALRLNHRFSERLTWTTMVSLANYVEIENIDLEGGYRLCDVDKNIGSDKFNECISVRGAGTLYNYARNNLSAILIDAESVLTYDISTSQTLSGGIAYAKQVFNDYLSEYELADSAGYVKVVARIQGDHTTNANLLKGFIQHTINLRQWSWVYGVRANYNTLNGRTLVSPRVLVGYRPVAAPRLSVNFGAGIYQQQPFYKEFRNPDGTILTDINGQSSLHLNLGMEYRITWWGRPFMLNTEVYYKNLWNLIPYIIENVRQQYYPEYTATGRAMGFEARLGGEFIPGTESWFSFGLMSAQERIAGVDAGWVRRPTDQRFKLAFVFEDHIPGDPTLRVNLNFQYGSGLPVGPPDNLQQRNSFGGDDYNRLDIGFSKIFGFTNKAFDFLRLGVEINNLFGARNAVSYTWITDVNNQQFAVPNYLTGRLFNVVLSTAF